MGAEAKYTVNLAEPLSFPTTHSDVAIMNKASNKIGVTYAKSVKAVHTTVAFFGTGAGVNFIHSALILPECMNSAKKESLPRV